MPQRHEVEVPYTGPTVVVRQLEPNLYQVSIEPRLPSGEGEPRQYRSKCEAYSAAQVLWVRHRLGCRDEVEGQIGRHYRDE